MNLLKVEGESASGVPVSATEVDHATVNQNQQVGVFHTVVSARLTLHGKAENSAFKMELQTVIDADGNAKTNVQHTQIRCNGN